MPAPYNYYCTNCDFTGCSMSTWGSHCYKLRENTIPINRKIGICHTCNSITSVEVLPDKERLEKLKTTSSNKNFIEKEKKRLQLLSGRESDARCLSCGSHDFDVIPHPEAPKDRDKTKTPWRTGLKHKDCGGRIYMKQSPASLFMGNSLERKFFDVEGVEL